MYCFKTVIRIITIYWVNFEIWAMPELFTQKVNFYYIFLESKDISKTYVFTIYYLVHEWLQKMQFSLFVMTLKKIL